MQFTLETFGDLRLLDRHCREIACPKLALVAAAYLLDVGHAVSRRELALLLWGNVPDAAAVNLRSLLFRTRKAFAAQETDPFQIGPDTIDIDSSLVSADFNWRPDDLSPLERLTQLKGAVAKGFLRDFTAAHGALAIWMRTIELRFGDLLRAQVIASATSQDEAVRHLAREAAVYLLDADPHDGEVLRVLNPRATMHGGFADAAAAPERPGVAGPIPDMLTSRLPYQALPRVVLLPPLPSRSGDLRGVLANALIEDVIIDLCGSDAFSVVAPYTSEKLAADPDKAEFLKLHNVSFALDTRLSGETLFVQLIFCPTDEVVWADRLAFDAASLVRSKERLVDSISRNIERNVVCNLPRYFSYLDKPDAYVEYLRGANELRGLTLPAIRRARKHFKSALQLNDRHTPALAALVRTLYMEWLVTARGDQALLDEAARLARDAIRCDPGQSSGYRELGMTEIYLGNVDASLDALAEAERISPHHADGLYSYGDTLVHASRPDEALVKLGRAIDYNPLPPDSYLWSAAGASYFLGRYEASIDFVNRMEDPSAADRIAAAAYAMAGNARQARLRRHRAIEANPDFDVMKWIAMVPFRDRAQKEHYREGLIKAGFK